MIELARSGSRRSRVKYNHTLFGSGLPAMHWVTRTVVSIDHIEKEIQLLWAVGDARRPVHLDGGVREAQVRHPLE